MSTGKREDYLEWEEYFMATAFLASLRSKDPKTQVGACIVNQRKIVVGVGYNGFPVGCNDDQFPWTKKADTPEDHKSLYVCHAELNAILNKNCESLMGCSMYVALFPCNECAKCIIQSGIKEVIYFSDKKSESEGTKASKRMFDAAAVQYRKCILRNKKIVIDFNKIDE